MKYVTCAGCFLLASFSLSAEQLYVRIQDLGPAQDGAYPGADIEAIELYDPDNRRAYYGARVIAAESPERLDQEGANPEELLGTTVLADWDAPYVYSLNGGWVVVAIDTGSNSVQDSFRLSIYEVDGSLYDWGGAPDPYSVSVARAPDGPWESLGKGSGSARFSLDGVYAPRLDDETATKISQLVAVRPANEAISDELRQAMMPTLDRLRSLDDRAQLAIELDSFYRFYNYRDHVVNEHGESDGGRVIAPWLLLKTAWKRYRELQ